MFTLRIGTIFSPLLVIATVGLLTSCANRPESIVVGAVPDDYRTNHPIIISEREQVLDLPVGAFTHRITPHQKTAIQGFLSDYGASGSAPVTILVPAGSANAAAASSVARDFAAMLHREGVAKGRVHTLSYDAAGADAAPIRLSYPIMKASAGPCGRWPEDILNSAENRHYANFGCSFQHNLAAQVANPVDFLGPRKMTPIDAENRDAAIERYKTGEVSDDFLSRSEIDF